MTPPTSSPNGGAGRLRNTSVWLATCATLVGIITGVFTLADRVFSSGDDPGPRLAAYQRDVGSICDDLNDAQAARVERTDHLDQEMRRTKQLFRARNLIINETQERIDTSSGLLARLDGLDAPEPLRARHAATVRVWTVNVGRFRVHRDRLEDTATPAGLVVVVAALPRSVIETAGQAVHGGLRRLGGDECDLDPPPTLKVVMLPRAVVNGVAPDTGRTRGHRESRHPTGPGSAPRRTVAAPGANATPPANAAPPSSPNATPPSIAPNTTPPSNAPSAPNTTPPAAGGGGGASAPNTTPPSAGGGDGP